MSNLTELEKARIVSLWSMRKSGLNAPEMTELCELVQRLLVRTRLPERFAAPQARADLIHDFIVQKIILNQHTTQAGSIESAHVLHTYFKRFAIDQLRDDARTVSLEGDTVDTSEGDGWDEPDAVENRDSGLEQVATNDVTADVRKLLQEAGIDIDAVRQSAQHFVASLEEAERAYLAFNACRDDEDQIPISGIASRLRLGSSYHYKAKQLGITGSKGGFYQGYETTRIGRWLTSLGARIAVEWQRELVALLIILCVYVLEHCGEECV